MQTRAPRSSFVLALLLAGFLIAPVFAAAQTELPPKIAAIMEKMKAGKELTPAEEQTLTAWSESMSNGGGSGPETRGAPKKGGRAIQAKDSGGMCPKPMAIGAEVVALTSEQYVTFSKSLALVYGRKAGKSLPKLKDALSKAEKPTDGADIGALLMMTGAGSASIYAIATSATQKPDDLLTASNLGVALKDMGDYRSALQVLLYAEKLRPNIALVSANLGWVYQEMGDRASAKAAFDKAARLAPDMASPQLGLGLVAECQGNHGLAAQHLRKALKQSFSAVGAKAYKQAKASQKSGDKGSQTQPVSDEKGQNNEFSVPELPIYEQKGKTAGAANALENYGSRLDARLAELREQYLSIGRVMEKQNATSSKAPNNSVVLKRDFAKQIFMFEDITTVLLGEGSAYHSALLESGQPQLEKVVDLVQRDAPVLTQYQEEGARFQERYTELLKEMEACGTSEPCQHSVQKKIDAVDVKVAELNFRICKLTKGELNFTYVNRYKTWKGFDDQLKSVSRDYYALTGPVLEQIWVPSLNESLNLMRELHIRTGQKASLAMVSDLPQLADEYNTLVCVEPEPPDNSTPPEEAKLPKEKPWCPFKKPLAFKAAVIGFELDCEHAKLEGGEGLLWSVQRDFKQHETTYWAGVGADASFGNGNLTASAKMGIEIRVGSGDTLQDAAFTSSVTSGVGGLMETEVSGRIAVEGGPSVTADANFTPPSLSDLMPQE